MSLFSAGQLNQLGGALEAAGWSAEDVTRLGQAGHECLAEIRSSLSGIVAAIEGGQTELWLAPGQAESWVRGRAILAHLTDTGLLSGCADLAELKAIQAKGLDFFRKYFRGKAVFGWRGVRVGFVPCLIEYGDEVMLDWRWLDYFWIALSPALRRK